MAKLKRDRMTREHSGSLTTWTFPDGDVEPLVFDESKVPEEIVPLATRNGYNQKIGDGAAIEYRQADGTSRRPTWAEKRARMAEIIGNLYNGVWSAAGEGGGGSAAFVAALMEFRPNKWATAAECGAYLDTAAAARGVSRAAIEKNFLANEKMGALREIHSRILRERASADLVADVAAEVEELLSDDDE